MFTPAALSFGLRMFSHEGGLPVAEGTSTRKHQLKLQTCQFRSAAKCCLPVCLANQLSETQARHREQQLEPTENESTYAMRISIMIDACHENYGCRASESLH